MSAPPLLLEKLTQDLQALCAQPSSAGQLHDLRVAADLVAAMLHGLGLQVRVVPTAGAPVVIARLAGRSRRTLLLYHHYDTAPPGPWRAWSHEPYQLAERDGVLYGRGVADGKGPLIAHIHGLSTLMQAEGDLPHDVVIVAEGEGLIGSPHLAAALAAHADLASAEVCLGSVGERDQHGIPFCYSGSKGLLQVRLTAYGGDRPLPSGFSATVRNPLWRLTWALGQIKGDDEDIRIPGFYDLVEGPTREENSHLRRIVVDEAGRLGVWGSKEFLFGMSRAALTRAETTLPTCNVSAVSCDPYGDLALIPASATALLDFQLVPGQEPAVILGLLSAHLADRGFGDLLIEPMPGGYAPARTPHDEPFIQALAGAGLPTFGAPLSVVPAGPFNLPLSLVAQLAGASAAAVGLTRAGNAVFGADEYVTLDDLARHGTLLLELLGRLG